MALIFPDKTPNFIQINLIEYKGYRESYQTSDIVRYPQQWFKTNQRFNLTYINLCRSDLEVFTAFHKNLALEQNRVFTIPGNVFKDFIPDLRQRIFCNYVYWVIEPNVLQITPKIVNTSHQTYDLSIDIKSVIA